MSLGHNIIYIIFMSKKVSHIEQENGQACRTTQNSGGELLQV